MKLPIYRSSRVTRKKQREEWTNVREIEEETDSGIDVAPLPYIKMIENRSFATKYKINIDSTSIQKSNKNA